METYINGYLIVLHDRFNNNTTLVVYFKFHKIVLITYCILTLIIYISYKKIIKNKQKKTKKCLAIFFFYKTNKNHYNSKLFYCVIN